MKAKLTSSVIFAFLMAAAALPNDGLQNVLTRMNQAASQFQAMSANVRSTTHVAVIDDNTEETGTVLMKKIRPGEVAGLMDIKRPDAKTVLFEKRQAQVYTPNVKTLYVYDLGKHGEQLDRFLMLGFGSSGTELAHDYDVKFLGTEQVGDKTLDKLELVPNAPEVKNVVTKIELWLNQNPGQPYPVQEKIYEPNGDYRLIQYSDLKINPPIKADALKLKLPSGVKTVYPQKQ